jgi:hypothetical protein
MLAAHRTKLAAVNSGFHVPRLDVVQRTMLAVATEDAWREVMGKRVLAAPTSAGALIRQRIQSGAAQPASTQAAPRDSLPATQQHPNTCTMSGGSLVCAIAPRPTKSGIARPHQNPGGGPRKNRKNRHEKHEFGPVNWITRRARRGM